MKKIYTLSLLFFLCIFVSAQVNDINIAEDLNFTQEVSYDESAVTTISNVSSTPLSSFFTANPIWEEDFANGIPTTWTNSPVPWVYRGPTTTPNQSVGSQGAYGTASNTINSQTQSDGFIIFDSDYYDNAGTQGNFGNGIHPTPHNGELMTGMIDLTNYPNVSLIMTSYFRTFLGQAFVNFYVNGTYVDQVQVHSLLAVNDATAADEEAYIGFPPGVSGNANVQLEFQFEGTTNSNTNGSGYYFWMLDDLKIVETPAHLIEMQEETYGGWLLSNPTTTGDMGIPYTFNPMSQAIANPYRIEGKVINLGSQNQTNAQLNTAVEESGAVVFSDNSAPVTLNVFDTLSVGTQTLFTPTNYGSHNIAFWGSSDSASTDTVVRTTIVTDTVYGRDYDWNSDGANAGSGYYLGRQNCGQVLANAFEVYTMDTVTSISFHVNDQSVFNAELSVELYEYDPTQGANTSAPLLLAQSNAYNLQFADIGNWVTLKLNNPVITIPGGGSIAYLAAVKGVIHPTDTSLISSSHNDATVTYIQDNGCNIGSGTPAFGYWYSASKTLMIRMNFGSQGSSSTNISENILNKKNLLKIVDVLGREVKGNSKKESLFYIYDDGTVEKRIFID